MCDSRVHNTYIHTYYLTYLMRAHLPLLGEREKKSLEGGCVGLKWMDGWVGVMPFERYTNPYKCRSLHVVFIASFFSPPNLLSLPKLGRATPARTNQPALSERVTQRSVPRIKSQGRNVKESNIQPATPLHPLHSIHPSIHQSC